MRRLALTLLCLSLPTWVQAQGLVIFDMLTTDRPKVLRFDLTLDGVQSTIGIPTESPDASTPSGYTSFRYALPPLTTGPHVVKVAACSVVGCIESAELHFTVELTGAPSMALTQGPTGLRIAWITSDLPGIQMPPALTLTAGDGAVWQWVNGHLQRNGVDEGAVVQAWLCQGQVYAQAFDPPNTWWRYQSIHQWENSVRPSCVP